MAQYDSEDKNKALITKLEAKAARNKAYKNSSAYKDEIKRLRSEKPAIGENRSKDVTKTSTWKKMDQRDRAKMTNLANKGGTVANLSSGEQRTKGRAKKAALMAARAKRKK
jgi:hypothetical protein|tara:strand:+ start:78 stop:410 length:333 start_codon:yes stop_codon:yes gene_type:complete